MEINYKDIEELFKTWELDIQIDIEDLDYLDEYLKNVGVKTDISLIGLGKLYNRFSEEVWASSWEDNAEGQFIEWLQSHKNSIKEI